MEPGTEREALHGRHLGAAQVRIAEARRGRASRRRCGRGDRARRGKVRRRLRAALPRARDDGADELHRAPDQGRLRHLGRHADSGSHAGRGHEAHRPRARAGPHPQPSPRRRIRPPPRVRRNDPRGADRAARGRAGPGHLDARGRHPARHVSPVLLRPLERRSSMRKATRSPGRIASPGRRSSHATFRPGSRTASIPTRSRPRRTSPTASATFTSTGSSSRRRPGSRRRGGAASA